MSTALIKPSLLGKKQLFKMGKKSALTFLILGAVKKVLLVRIN